MWDTVFKKMSSKMIPLKRRKTAPLSLWSNSHIRKSYAGEYHRHNGIRQIDFVLDPPSNVFFQLVLISWMATLSSCLIWQIISFILPPNEYGCVYAWTTLGNGPAIDLQKIPIHLFRWSSFWSWPVYKQAKFSHLGHRKPAGIHWKALMRILVQMYNWVIFLWKWARRGRYSHWRSLSGHVERIFVHKYWRGGYWQHLVSTGPSTRYSSILHMKTQK